MTSQPTFTAPPGWPPAPEGFQPAVGWSPDPSWPAAPEGWQFWVDADGQPAAAPEGMWSGPAGHAPTMPIPTAPTTAMPTAAPPPPPSGQPWPPPAATGQPLPPVPPIPQAGSPWGPSGATAGSTPPPAGMPSDPFATPAPSAPPAPGSPSGATYPGATASGANAPGTAYPGGPSYPGASYPGGNLPGTAYPGGPTYPGPGTPAGPPRKSKAPQIVGIVAGALVLLLVGGFFAVRGLVSSVVSDAKPSATAPVAAPTTKAVSTPSPSKTSTPTSTDSTAPTSRPVPTDSLILAGPTLTKAQYRAMIKSGKLGNYAGVFTDTVDVTYQPDDVKGIRECDALSQARRGYVISSAMQTVDENPAYSLLYDTPLSNLRDRTDEENCFAKARALGLSGYDELDIEVLDGVETRGWYDDADTEWLEAKYGNVDMSAPLPANATAADRKAFASAVKAQVDAAAKS